MRNLKKIRHLFLSFACSIFAYKAESSAQVDKAKAEKNICQALGTLRITHNFLVDLQIKISGLNDFRADICDKVIPADKELRKLRGDIETARAHIKGRPTANEQKAVNEQVSKHNKIHDEITPKLDTWHSEYQSVNRLFSLSKKPFNEGTKELKSALLDYWEAAISIGIANGDAKISDVIDCDVDLSEEDKFRDCVRIRIDALVNTFHGPLLTDINQWKDRCNPLVRQRINSVFNMFLGLYSPLVGGVLKTCERKLDVPKLFEALLVSACFKTTQKKNEL